MDKKLCSWFLGPNAENADIFEHFLLEAFRDAVYCRRNFHPKDKVLITKKEKMDETFQDSISLFEQEFQKLLADLKRDVPFSSPRYIGHMLGDQLLPATLGYFAAMLHNPNNVTPEVSPITTEYEEKVAKQLANMIGYREEQFKTWGHLTSGGTIANFEALWVARNLKYFPIAAKKTAEALKLTNIQIHNPSINKNIDLINADEWTLLNLDTDEILNIREKLYTAYSNQKDGRKLIDENLEKYTISGKGIHQFFADSNEIKPGLILISATAHYSLIKIPEALGLGKNQIKKIPVDKYFRMDIKELRKILEKCINLKQPIIALTSILGSTEEGSVDYIHEIEKIKEEFKDKGLNFYHHCDAAWGGYVRTLFFDKDGNPIKKIGEIGEIVKITDSWPLDEIFKSFNSISKTDSVTIDPHKLGYIPYPAGAIVFKNNNVRDLISFKAPYIFHEENGKRPFIGQYILEGSKPGATAAACWLAHKVVPLNQSGYGNIIGKSIKGAHQLHRKLSLDLAEKLDRLEIKLKTLTDPPDINLLCFIVNKKNNTSLETMNSINKKIYDELKFNPEEVVQTHEFIISHTNFEFEQYGQAMKEHLEEMGILNANEEFEKVGKVMVLRCTIMDPWIVLSRGSESDYIAGFALELERIIKLATKS